MIQKTGKMIEKEETITICDFCKRDTTSKMLGDNKSIEHSGQIYANFGYYSHRDGDSFRFDMCSDCATKIEKLLRANYLDLPATTNHLFD